MKKVLLIFILFLTAGCSTLQTVQNVKPSPIEPPKGIQASAKIPYSVNVEIHNGSFENICNKHHDCYVEPSLRNVIADAIKYFVYPYFDTDAEENIYLEIYGYMKIYEDKGYRVIEVPMSLYLKEILRNGLPIYHYIRTGGSDYFSIHNDNVNEFRDVSVTGYSKTEYSYPINDAARDAIVDAVKKFRENISAILLNPESLSVQLKSELNPFNSSTYYTLAHLSFLAKKYDDALAKAKRALDLNPQYDINYALLGDIYKALKNYPEATKNYEKALSLNPKYYPFYKRLSEIYLFQENYTENINLWQKAASTNPEWNVNSQLALAYTYGGRFDDAITSLNKAIELSTYTGIGVNISIKENYPVVMQVSESGPAKKAGIEVGDRIIKINGQSTKGWDGDKVSQNVRGEAGTDVTITIERKGLDKPVEKTIKRQRILKEDAAGPLGLRSLVYAVKGDYEKASKDAETAYSLNPNNGWSKSARSYSYIIAGKPDEAIKILSTIKDSSFDRLLECLAYSKKGDLKKSAEIYASIPEDYLMSKNALRQYFKNAVLESLSPYVESKKENIKSLEANGQYREALKEYAELLRIADQTKRKEILGHVAVLLKKQPYLMELPEEARKYALRAEVMTKEGKFDEAVKAYKEAIRIAPFYPLLYKAIALNYAELKDYKKAIENMNTYIELYPDAPDVRAAKDEIYKWEFMMEKGGK